MWKCEKSWDSFWKVSKRWKSFRKCAKSWAKSPNKWPLARLNNVILKHRTCHSAPAENHWILTLYVSPPSNFNIIFVPDNFGKKYQSPVLKLALSHVLLSSSSGLGHDWAASFLRHFFPTFEQQQSSVSNKQRQVIFVAIVSKVRIRNNGTFYFSISNFFVT